MGAIYCPENFKVSDPPPFQTLPDRFVQDKRYWTRLNQRMGRLVNAVLLIILLLAIMLMGLAFGRGSMDASTLYDRQIPIRTKGL